MLGLAEEIGEQARIELDASGVTISRFVAATQEWVTVANIGRLGLGEQRFPTDERYSRSRFPEITSKLERGKRKQLGQAKKTIDGDNTIIVEGAGSEKTIKGRIKQIQDEIKKTTSDYDKEKLQERLAKLTGGVAQINVGGVSEAEMKERKARIEDALHATRAAIEEGIVPGGGVALIRCIDSIKGFETDRR